MILSEAERRDIAERHARIQSGTLSNEEFKRELSILLGVDIPALLGHLASSGAL